MVVAVGGLGDGAAAAAEPARSRGRNRAGRVTHSLAAIAYPTLDDADRGWVESFRAPHDPQARMADLDRGARIVRGRVEAIVLIEVGRETVSTVGRCPLRGTGGGLRP